MGLLATIYNKQPIWFNSDIRHRIKCLRTLMYKLNKCPTGNNKKYKNSSNSSKQILSPTKANYESDLITAFANNNSKIYKFIRSLAKSHTIHPNTSS